MTDITVNVENAEVIAELRRLERAVSNMTPAFKAIGQVIKSKIEMTFRDQKSPDGVNWAALSPVTKMNRAMRVSGGKRYTASGNHTTAKFTRAYLSAQPLNDTGRLKNSFTYVADDKKVQVGTNVVYAAMQNYGGTKARFPHLFGSIPARSFIPPTGQLPADWQDEVIAIINRHIQRASG